MKDIKFRLEQYKQANDIHQYDLLLNIATDFICAYNEKLVENGELELGIEIIKEIETLTYLSSLARYEHEYDLHIRIHHTQIKTFKTCIPPSHAKLKGITELLLGMKENAVG